MAKKKVDPYEFLELEKQVLQIELERSRLSREKGMVILNKSVFLYFSFMFVGVLGFVNDYISSAMLNFIIVMGLVALVVGTVPYIIATHREQKKLSEILKTLMKRTKDISDTLKKGRKK